MSTAEELAKLAQLRDQGVLSEEEFQALKAAVLRDDRPATELVAPAAAMKKKSGAGKGCLILAAVIVVLLIIGAIASGGDQAAPGGADNSAVAAEETATKPSVGLFGPQANAARSAEQYLAMSGFSRLGLIEQLSSDAGNGYSVADATAAVDSLTVDWNEQAGRSAKQYLDMTGFSCAGLIEQLSSDAGSKYTKAQARAGAKQAGAC